MSLLIPDDKRKLDSSKPEKCYLCEEENEKLLDLDDEVNNILKSELQKCLEEKIVSKTICYSCRNKFESAIHTVKTFKNAHYVARKGVASNDDGDSVKGSKCSFCGQLNNINLNQHFKISSFPRLVEIIKSRIKDSLFVGVEHFDDIVCFTCLRLLKRLEWIKSELEELELQVKSNFNVQRKKQDLEILVTSGNSDNIDLNEIIFLVLNDDESFCEDVESPCPPCVLPRVPIFSKLAIESLKVERRGADQHIMILDDRKYISFRSLRDLAAVIFLVDSKLHVSLKHSDNKGGEFLCSECSFSSGYLSTLLRHIQCKHKVRQEMCQKENLVLYKCSHCKEEFDRKSDFKCHNLVCKSGLPTVTSVECQLCSKIFRSKDSLNVHISRDHEGSKTPWTCVLCCKGFTRKASYEEHINRHKGVKERKCEACQKYYYETAYWRHMKTVHASEKDLKFTCQVCSKQFAHRFKLKQHYAVHMSSNEKQVPCPYQDCKKNFANAEKARSHVRLVHETRFSGPLVCGECGATYSKYSSICSHQRNCHNRETVRPLSCPLCPQTFSTSASLNKHITLNHNTNRQFLCKYEDCGSSFPSLSDLQQHKQTDHNAGEQSPRLEDLLLDDVQLEGVRDDILFIEITGTDSQVRILREDAVASEDANQKHVKYFHEENETTSQSDKPKSWRTDDDKRKTARQVFPDQNQQHEQLDLNKDKFLEGVEQQTTRSKQQDQTEPHSQLQPSQHDNSVCHDSRLDPVLSDQVQVLVSPQPGHSEQSENILIGECNKRDIVDYLSTATPESAQYEMKASSEKVGEESRDNNMFQSSQKAVNKMKGTVFQLPAATVTVDGCISKAKQIPHKSKIQLESVLLTNNCRRKDRQQNSYSLATLVNDPSLPPDFPPLPSSPPDTLLDQPIGDDEEGDELTSCIKQKFVSHAQFELSLGAPSSRPTAKKQDSNVFRKTVDQKTNGERCEAKVKQDALNLHNRAEDASLEPKVDEDDTLQTRQDVKEAKNFECELCKKRFSTKKILKRHYRIHTGDKPYSCEYCGKCFGAASNLSEHRTLHTGRLPYSCNLCGSKFRLWSTLKKHRTKCEQ